MGSSQERAFAEFVASQSETLYRCAYLCHGESEAASAAVEASLASVYADWKGAEPARVQALRQVSAPEAAYPDLPWRSEGRIDLVDVAPSRPTPKPMLVRELDDLPAQTRRVLVLSLIAGLSATQIARVIGVVDAEAQDRLDQARGYLDSRRAVYGSRGTLAEALDRAVPPGKTHGANAGSARAHGRFLVKARRRRALVLVAAGVAAIALGVQGIGAFQSRVDISSERPAPQASIVPASVPTFPPPPSVAEAPCDTEQTACQDLIAQTWRYEIFDTTVEYLDPDGEYFSIVDGDEDSWEWDGDGSLTVDVLSLDGGTRVSVQIAASRKFAAQCGSQTDQDCRRQRFMSGNWFNLTQSSNSAEGVEVQFRPFDEVITIVASDTGKGKTLPVDRGQLMAMIQDPRLRLPPV